MKSKEKPAAVLTFIAKPPTNSAFGPHANADVVGYGGAVGAKAALFEYRKPNANDPEPSFGSARPADCARSRTFLPSRSAGLFRSDGPSSCFGLLFRPSARSTRLRLPHNPTSRRKSASTVHDGSLLEVTFWTFVSVRFIAAGIRLNGHDEHWCLADRTTWPCKWCERGLKGLKLRHLLALM